MEPAVVLASLYEYGAYMITRLLNFLLPPRTILLSEAELLASVNVGGLHGVSSEIRSPDGFVVAKATCITEWDVRLPDGYAAIAIGGKSAR